MILFHLLKKSIKKHTMIHLKPLNILLIMLLAMFSCGENNITKPSAQSINDTIYPNEFGPSDSIQAEETPLDREAFFRDFREFDKYDNGLSEKPSDFSGVYKLNHGGGTSFTLTLQQTTRTIRGSYCGYNEMRHDCGLESQGVSDCPVKGIVLGDTCYVSFISCYRGTKGLAKLYKTGYNVYWTTLEEPPYDFLDYFSAPSEGELINQMVSLGKYHNQATNAHEAFKLSTLLYPKTTKVFNPCKLYKSTDFNEVITEIQAGETVSINTIGARYTLVGDEHDELVLHSYQVEYKNQKGYIKREHLPLKSYTTKNGIDFIIGMDVKTEELKFKAYQSDRILFQTRLYENVFTKDAYGNLFVEFVFGFKPLNDLKIDNLMFYEFSYANNGSGGYAGSSFYYWNGAALRPLEINRNNNSSVINQRLEIRSNSEDSKDTLIYVVETGDITDDSGEFSDIKTNSYYFISNNDSLKEVFPG